MALLNIILDQDEIQARHLQQQFRLVLRQSGVYAEFWKEPNHPLIKSASASLTPSIRKAISFTVCSILSVGNYINGHRTPRGFADIVPVAKALDVSLDYLAGVIGPDEQDDKNQAGYPALKTIMRL